MALTEKEWEYLEPVLPELPTDSNSALLQGVRGPHYEKNK